MRTYSFSVCIGVAVITMIASIASVRVLAGEDGEVFPHPLFGSKVSFPLQKVADSRHAAVVAMDAYLKTLPQPVSLGTPLPMKLENDDEPFGKKGDDLWEIRFYSEPSHKVTQTLVVNARTGAYKKVSYTQGTGTLPPAR